MFQKVKQRIGNVIDGKSKTPRKSGLLMKIIFMGQERSGKTSLLKQYNQQIFEEEYKPTVGADFFAKDIKVEDRYISVAQFWDTAGQERLQSLGTSFYRSADACVFVFDVGSESSFNKLNALKDFFWSVCEEPKVHMIVIGNKIDQPNRKITKAQAEAWCKANGNIYYLECSAKDAKLTEKTFKEIIRITMDDTATFQTKPAQVLPTTPAGADNHKPITEATFTNEEEFQQTSQQQSKEMESSQEKQVHAQQEPSTTHENQTDAQHSQPGPDSTTSDPNAAVQPSSSEDKSYTLWITVGAAVVSIAAFALYRSLSYR